MDVETRLYCSAGPSNDAGDLLTALSRRVTLPFTAFPYPDIVCRCELGTWLGHTHLSQPSFPSSFITTIPC